MARNGLGVTYDLVDASNVAINDMDASWTTKAYEMIDHLHLCIQLQWDSLTPTGTMTLEYSGDPIREGAVEPTNWIAKDITNIDGTFQELMYLDANLPIACFRLRFQHVSGAANLISYIVKKG